VTGAPNVTAMAAIERLEPVDRGVYCGAVGWIDADTATGDLSVAIRTFWVHDQRLSLGTGGAITWDSQAAAEWAETRLKAANLVRIASAARPHPAPTDNLGVSQFWVRT
jgi:para-aminobenzoate synthetase component 1